MILGRRDGISVVKISLGVELSCAVEINVGEGVGLEEGRMDGMEVVGLLVGESSVTLKGTVVLLEPLYFSSWRFFLSSSLVLRRSSFRNLFLSICFSVRRIRCLGPTLGAMPLKRSGANFAASKNAASKRAANKMTRKGDGIATWYLATANFG